MTADQPASQLDPRRWRALVLIAAAQFMVILDASIVNVALPTIKTSLHFSQSNLLWVVNGYALTFGGFLLLGGRSADLLGRRRMFMAGMALFGLASLAGGFAHSEAWLVTARAAQGMGAAIISPSALALLQNLFHEGPERTKALGVWGAVAGSGGAVGVLAGGMLTTWLSWRWVLFVNVPVAVVVIAISRQLLTESRAPHQARPDVLGAVLGTGGLVVLVYGLVKTDHHPFGSQRTILTLALAALLLAAFVAVELTRRDPLIRLGIYRNRNVASANAIGFLNGMCLFSMFYFISLYMQQVLGYSALRTGLCYLPLCLFVVLAATMAPRVIGRVGVRFTIAGAIGLLSVGLFLFSGVSFPGSFGSDVLLPSCLAAIGLGTVFVSVTMVAVSGVSRDEAGLASGLLTTAQQVGAALGIAVLSTVAISHTKHVVASATTRIDPRAAVASGFSEAFFVAGCIAATGVLVALLAIGRVRAPRGDETPAPAAA